MHSITITNHLPIRVRETNKMLGSNFQVFPATLSNGAFLIIIVVIVVIFIIVVIITSDCLISLPCKASAADAACSVMLVKDTTRTNNVSNEQYIVV